MEDENVTYERAGAEDVEELIASVQKRDTAVRVQSPRDESVGPVRGSRVQRASHLLLNALESRSLSRFIATSVTPMGLPFPTNTRSFRLIRRTYSYPFGVLAKHP